MTSGGRRPLAASRAGTIAPAVAIVLMLAGCSAPQYEVWRLPAEGASWQTCGLDRGGEERPASWCPSGRVIVATAADLPLDRHRIDATIPQGIVPDGPVVLVTESAVYDPQGLADTKTLLDGMVRHDPSATLFRLGRAFPQLGVRTRLVSRRLPTMPSGVTLRLPRGTTGQVGAWTVAAWPGGRARDVVVLRPTTVPAKSRLAISYGIAPGGRVPNSPPVTFRIETTEGRALWGGRLDPRADGAGWRDVEIDLPDASGAALALRMIAEVDGPPGAFSYPVWGQPAVLVPHDAASGSRPNVLLLSLDTLRGDAVSLTGGPRALTPELNRFATGGVAFAHAFSTFPSTAGSHMTMMTSMHPCEHQVHRPDASVALSTAATTLAEAFANAGWSTLAVTEDGMINGALGFARGFDRYVDQPSPASNTLGRFSEGIRRAMRWLGREKDRPFFMFLHTYQAHADYKVPPHLREVFPVPPGANKIERLHIDYEAGVRYTDELVGGLLKELDARGLLATTLVAITSDHGEAFDEHGKWGHGHDVYDEELHVPLILHHPTLARGGRRIEEPVSLIDLAPTLLDAAGIPSPASFRGRSVLGLVRGETRASEPSPIFGEQLWWPMRRTMYRAGSWSLVVNRDGPAVYDVDRDPGQLHNLIPSWQPLALIATTIVEAFRHECEVAATTLQQAGSTPAAPLDPKREQALRALGYIK